MNEHERLLKMLSEKEAEEKAQKYVQENEKERQERAKKAIKELFGVLTGRVMTEEELKEYEERFAQADISYNVKTYCAEKNIRTI